VIAVLILGVSIANALAPVVQWITDHLGIARSITIILIYLVFVLLFGVIIYINFPVFFAQVKSLIDLLNVWAPQAINWLGQAGFDANTLLNSFSSVSSRLGGLLFALPATIFSSLLDFVLVIFISLYWLILMKGMRDYFLSFFPASNRPQVVNVLSEMGSAMGGYLRGSAIDGLIYGTAKFIGLSVIGVPYALTLGILAATLEFFPTIGAIISALAATLVALSVSPTLALITLAFTVVLQ
jgi:predicted PurR-regulated permease PerM